MTVTCTEPWFEPATPKRLTRTMVLSFYLLQVFPPQGLKFARRKEQTQPIQTQRFPLLVRLCVSCLVHCWCVPRAGPVSVSGKNRLSHPPNASRMRWWILCQICGGFFFRPQMCTKLWKFQRKIRQKNSFKISSLIFQKFVPSDGKKFTNFFVHLQILHRHSGSKTPTQPRTSAKNLRVNNLSGGGWLTLIQLISPLLLHMTCLKYCHDFSAQAFGAWALKQLKAPHTVSTHRRQNPKTKIRPKSIQLELSPKNYKTKSLHCRNEFQKNIFW